MIKQFEVKSCCNSKTFVLELEKAITKLHLPSFLKEGYAAPDHYRNAGLFYIQKDGLVASGSFGARMINVKCSGEKCFDKLETLKALLENIIK